MKNLREVPELQEVKVREDIVLHPLAEHHCDRFLEILDDDPTIRDRVQFAADTKDKDDFMQAVVDNQQEKGVMRYAIEKNTRCIGLVSLWRLGEFRGSDYPNTYGFGYFLDSNERGQGIVPDAVRALMRVAVKSLEVDKFIAFCEDDNKPSQNVLQRAGFVPTDDVVHFENTGWTERRYEHIVAAN
jgi:RimJ/RimL family protein N-acetyltransferase